MGYYLNSPTFRATGKAAELISQYGAEQLMDIPQSLPKNDEALVCVVRNEQFDAAALCYSQNELVEFSAHDGRPKTWLIMDATVAHELAGFVSKLR
jgi:hypothetical protein